MPALPFKYTGTCSRCQAYAASGKGEVVTQGVLATSPPLRTAAAAKDLLVLTAEGRADVILSRRL
jgi:hypothetical protein